MDESRALSSSDERVKWVDYAKGIAILLVIVSHTVSNQVIRGAIFSFHMPLFFILSGYTTKRADSAEALKQRALKTFRQLIIPAYVLWIVHTAVFIVLGRVHSSAWQLSLTALFAGGLSYDILGAEIPSFGMVWFLVTLFIVRNVYSVLDYYTGGKHMTAISLITSVCGVIIGQFIFLPFDFDIAMASMVFFHFGSLLKNKQITFSVKKLIISIFAWGGVLLSEYIISQSYFEMVPRRYPIAPLSFIGAIAGTMACVYVCIFSDKHLPDKFNEQMCLIGKNSIMLFSIHYLDDIYYSYISNSLNQIILSIIRVSIDLIIFYILYYMKTKSPIQKNQKVG